MTAASKFYNKNSFVTMEEKRKAVVALHLDGKAQKSIVTELNHLKISKTFVSRTIKRWEETGSVNDKPRSGRPKCARTNKVIENVKDRIRRDPRCSANQLAQEMGMSTGTMNRLLRDDLGLNAYKRQQVDEFEDGQKKLRLDGTRERDSQVVIFQDKIPKEQSEASCNASPDNLNAKGLKRITTRQKRGTSNKRE